MANETSNNVTLPNANVNVPLEVFKHDPVEWAKKTKMVYGNVAELTYDPHLNVRFRGGVEVFGVKPKDTYDIPGMKQGIADGGGINEPILVSVRKDGKKVTLRGNRRTAAGQEMEADPTTPPELLKALRERTPMILLYNLSHKQEMELINDQTQKPFLRSEVVRHIFALRKEKWTFEQIAAALWETLGKFSGNAKKVAEVRETTDPVLKKDKIKTWLRGTLDNYLLWGCDLGPVVQKIILVSEMGVDGVLPADSEKPYFNATKNSQKRIAALKKAREADGSKWNGQMLVEGSEFKKVADQFHQEDYGTVTATATTTPKKMLDRKTVEGMKDSFQSRAVKAIIERILGNEVADLSERDDFAAIMEAKEMLLTQYLPRLKPDVAVVVRLCLVSPDPTDFQSFLEQNCVEMPAEPVVNEPAEPGNSDEYKLTDEPTA